jgi:hypothetical protein
MVRKPLIAQTTATIRDVQIESYAYYFVAATDFAGNEGSASTVLNTVGVPDPGFIPKVAALYHSRPNPFRESTLITFDVPREKYVRLEVYDVRGRSVGMLVDKVLPAVRYSVPWLGRSDSRPRLGSGIYFTVIKIRGYSATRKVVLLQ